jgi:hypothetical protein
MSAKERLFHNNCQLWAKFNPKQALLLPYLECQEPPHFKDTEQEAEDWFLKLDLEKVFILCVYGMGLGYYYDAAKCWLHQDPARRLVFLEDNLAVIRHFFETPKAEEILKDPQVQLLYFADLKDNDAVLEILYWNFAMTRILVTALKYYAEKKKESFADLHQKIAYDFALKNSLVEEYMKFGGAFFVNFYQNILELPGSFLGNKTFGSFHKVPAIICGAGPSLVKTIPLLSSLGDKALIFAGGSALNALNAAGIQPHLGAGIDPNPAQFSRLKANQAYEVPFYYRNRMHHEAFKLIHGPRLYITGCGGYDVSDWYEEKLKIKSEFMDEGHNVINFCLQIAHQLGCNPIIFAGMDLAFTDMKTYAPGIEEEVEFDPNKPLDEEDYDSKPILRKDIEGKPIHTLWKWVAESQWIADFAKEHGELTILNCTEGGLGFPGIPNEPLKAISEQYLTRQYPILDRLNGEIQNSALPQATLPKMIKMTQELQESLQRCVSHLTVLIDEARHLYGKIEKEKAIPESLQSGYAALCETELADEPGYQHVLEIFNAVQMRMLSRELHESKSDSELKKVLKKLELNIKRLSFLRETAGFNREAISYALQNKKKTNRKKQPSINIPPMKAMEFADFHPILLPSSPQEGDWMDAEHTVRILRQYGKQAEEARVEKDAVLDGQCLLYYPGGTLKAETFYKNGKLHGPSTYYSRKGGILSKSYFVEGLQHGESRWYYPTGSIYAIRHFHQGKLQGEQKYFYPNGSFKTTVHYSQGQLQGKPILYSINK